MFLSLLGSLSAQAPYVKRSVETSLVRVGPSPQCVRRHGLSTFGIGFSNNPSLITNSGQKGTEESGSLHGWRLHHGSSQCSICPDWQDQFSALVYVSHGLTLKSECHPMLQPCVCVCVLQRCVPVCIFAGGTAREFPRCPGCSRQGCALKG